MTELNDHNSRAHALLSASSAARWLACPPSAVAAEIYPQQDTEFTREGTVAHEVAEVYARGGEIPTEAIGYNTITQEMVNCAIDYRDYIAEQTKSDDAKVLLEQRVDFSPWVPKGFGTADCIIIQKEPIFGDTILTIIDYKYGKGVSVSAEDNPQLKLYALGALNDFGIAFDVGRIEMHIFQPRLRNISTYAMSKADLLTWAEETVKPIATKAARGEGETDPGAHCKFCPHAGNCPSLTAYCTEYIETHDIQVTVPKLAPHEVAEILQMEPIINMWLKRVKDQALTAMLDGGEIPGFKVVAGRSQRGWADDLEVADVLRANGYSTEEITETNLLSVSKMEKALGKKKLIELVGGHILTHAGAPTVVSETDKRPVYDRRAETLKDFD